VKITKEKLKKVILEAYNTQMTHSDASDLKDVARAIKRVLESENLSPQGQEDMTIAFEMIKRVLNSAHYARTR
jgi:hypothetical protein